MGTRWVGDRVAPAPARAGIQAVADFDNDGRADVLWRDGARLTIWFAGDAEGAATLLPGARLVIADASWTVVEARDFDRDGRADVLWRDAA